MILINFKFTIYLLINFLFQQNFGQFKIIGLLNDSGGNVGESQIEFDESVNVKNDSTIKLSDLLHDSDSESIDLIVNNDNSDYRDNRNLQSPETLTQKGFSERKHIENIKEQLLNINNNNNNNKNIYNIYNNSNNNNKNNNNNENNNLTKDSFESESFIKVHILDDNNKYVTKLQENALQINHALEEDNNGSINASSVLSTLQLSLPSSIATSTLPSLKPQKFIPTLSHMPKKFYRQHDRNVHRRIFEDINDLSTTINNLLERQTIPIVSKYRNKYKSRCQCERISNCRRIQISIYRCPADHFMCCS